MYFIDQKIPVNAQSFIMRNLTADSTYSLKLAAKNELGMGEFATFHSEVKTLKVKYFENISSLVEVFFGNYSRIIFMNASVKFDATFLFTILSFAD